MPPYPGYIALPPRLAVWLLCPSRGEQKPRKKYMCACFALLLLPLVSLGTGKEKKKKNVHVVGRMLVFTTGASPRCCGSMCVRSRSAAGGGEERPVPEALQQHTRTCAVHKAAQALLRRAKHGRGRMEGLPRQAREQA
jgi:hypothetical protein